MPAIPLLHDAQVQLGVCLGQRLFLISRMNEGCARGGGGKDLAHKQEPCHAM